MCAYAMEQLSQIHETGCDVITSMIEVIVLPPKTRYNIIINYRI